MMKMEKRCANLVKPVRTLLEEHPVHLAKQVHSTMKLDNHLVNLAHKDGIPAQDLLHAS